LGELLRSSGSINDEQLSRALKLQQQIVIGEVRDHESAAIAASGVTAY